MSKANMCAAEVVRDGGFFPDDLLSALGDKKLGLLWNFGTFEHFAATFPDTIGETLRPLLPALWNYIIGLAAKDECKTWPCLPYVSSLLFLFLRRVLGTESGPSAFVAMSPVTYRVSLLWKSRLCRS
mmetsp:Transcript_26285/g.80833  ORF Transcript_26285/g.80833 Transcript_26285/m.80833 type:complete len:127 (-) Transcript_26285:769-1149(-)